jgi:hypothetical protein
MKRDHFFFLKRAVAQLLPRKLKLFQAEIVRTRSSRARRLLFLCRRKPVLLSVFTSLLVLGIGWYQAARILHNALHPCEDSLGLEVNTVVKHEKIRVRGLEYQVIWKANAVGSEAAAKASIVASFVGEALFNCVSAVLNKPSTSWIVPPDDLLQCMLLSSTHLPLPPHLLQLSAPLPLPCHIPVPLPVHVSL